MVFCNGYSKRDVKRWEAKSWQYYVRLAQLLMDAGYTVGSLGEKGEAVKGTDDLTGLPFEKSLGIVKGAKLLVSNDTGLYHAANLLGTQTLAMFTASWKAPMFVVPSPKKQTET